jgi:hypothetical protein
MRTFAVFLLCAGSAFAGYASKASVTFTASGSTTDVNITLAFFGSDPALRTIGNGGQVQHTLVRSGAVVPADFVLTNDTTCGSLTGGYNWGIESYSATAGTITGWVRIPAITPGTAVTPTVCVGNAAVSSYQGGAPGAEFDSNTRGVWHFPNGTALNAADFSGNGNAGSITAATAAPGQVDGAASFSTSAYIDIPGAAISGLTSATFSVWIKTTDVGRKFMLSGGAGVCGDNEFGDLEINNTSLIGARFQTNGGVDIQASTNTADGNWHRVVVTYSPTGASIQIDNGTPSSATGTMAAFTSSPPLEVGNLCNNFNSGEFGWNGSIDELFVSNVVRSSDWIATEFNNQSSPPVISAFTSLGGGTSGGAAHSLSQGFIFYD